jgi:P27 family predicted phage terminase small subunit
MSGRLKRAPPPPKHLSDRAADEWRRLGPICIALETLSRANLRAFEMLCNVLAAEGEARETLAKEGSLVKTAAGGSKPHPCLRAAEKATEQAIRLLDMFELNSDAEFPDDDEYDDD